MQTINTPEVIAEISGRFLHIKEFQPVVKNIMERKSKQICANWDFENLTLIVGVYPTKGDFNRFIHCPETKETFHF